MSSRYGTDPGRINGQKDIIEHLKGLFDRTANSETSLRAGHTAIEDGDFVVRNGDIIVSETEGDVVLRIVHGLVPEIRMWPLGENDTHRVVIFGYDDPDAGQNAAFLIEKEDSTTDGGKILLGRDYSVFGFQPEVGEETHLFLNYNSETAVYRGKWFDQGQVDSHQGLYCGSFVATSGFSTWTHTYFTPFATACIPVCTVLHAGSTISWTLDSFSTSQFTVRFSSTTNNKTVNFWAFRI